MIFEELFLRSENQDCLGQILSNLTCQDLANAARTCKVLQQTIFESDAKERNVNLIWQGAENALTNPGDREFNRVGSNAKEHCCLFAVASKAAKACELSDGIEQNRMKVNDVLANLMNLRGFNANGASDKNAFGANLDLEDAMNLTEPTKAYHHDIFVRMTRVDTREVISEGFCQSKQALPWFSGLELSRQCRDDPDMKQGLRVFLNFKSLIESEEIQNFLRVASTTGHQGLFEAVRSGLGINLTVVVIDRRNCKVQCLFQHDQTKKTRLRMLGPGDERLQMLGLGHFLVPGSNYYDFHPIARWGSEWMRLGRSKPDDVHCLDFSLCLFVGNNASGYQSFVPVLFLNVEHILNAQFCD